MAEFPGQARDIDVLIRQVRRQMPDIEVAQWRKTRESDDDNLWWFLLPQVKPNIQIENSACPFLVETNEQCCGEALRAMTIEESVAMIVDYLVVSQIRLLGKLCSWSLKPSPAITAAAST